MVMKEKEEYSLAEVMEILEIDIQEIIKLMDEIDEEDYEETTFYVIDGGKES
ncbi:hypothetical protein [Bacillus thuringiensis]|uniref:hypothetical protein n=1 Tax=Bacillus thuringiensis TaxID=1428 RepID=UPI0021D67CEE|nr:hypothetical protein [Bacillus thuringiensis]MCU7667505.1 hypothetical protein [Bacillus thuringiensis]